MTILESKFEDVAGAIDAGDVLQHEYDLKFQIVLKAAQKTIPGKKFLVTTLKIIQETTNRGEILELFDTNDNQIQPDLVGIDARDMKKMFCVEIGGTKNQLFMFGVKIQSTVPYSVLKERSDGQLKAHSTYMSLHRGGFNYGVNWAALGFFTEKHPKFVNHEAIREDILEKFVNGWNNDRNYWTAKMKKEIQTQMNTTATPFDPATFPLLVTSMASIAKDAKPSVRSYTVSVTVPHKFTRIGRMILDYLLLTAKVLQNYVPLAFQYEDPIAFRNILKAHDNWMENHRNIQICNVPTADHWNDPATDGTTLKTLLAATPNILDVNFDSKHSRLNVSVDRKNFATISNSLSEKICAANFPFQPTVRKVTISSTNNSNGSTTTTATKYSQILSGVISSATSRASSNDQTDPNYRRNAWNKRVPSTIDFYGTTSASFPPLRPTSPITDNQSHEPTSDGITASTIQSAIQEALAEVQRKHNAEIQAMKEDYNKFQAEILSLREQIAQRDQSATDRLERKIDLLMQHLDLRAKDQATTQDEPAPSPFRKKQRSDRTSSVASTGISSPNENPGWDFDDDDDVPSSQDSADAMSGSEG